MTGTWDDLVIGHQFDEVTYCVSPEAVRAFTDAVGFEHPWYAGDSPLGGPVVPPTLIQTDYSALLSQVLPPFTGMHARHRVQFFRPIPVNAPVHVSGRIENKFVKRGKNYVVVSYEARGEDGSVFMQNTITTTIDGYVAEGGRHDSH